jgi:signal transduction histidine kinase
LPDLAAESVDIVSQIDAVPKVLDVVCAVTGMGFAAVARVTESRWIACGVLDRIAFGLTPGNELTIETTICNEIRDHGQIVIVENVAEDPHFANHHTPAQYGFQSYISCPITLPDGSFFGTLCAIDPRPNTLNTPEIIDMFRLFSELIAFHIDAHLKMEQDRHANELREQFIAVLGHDLRNPLASIDAGTRMLARTDLSEKSKTVVDLMRQSVVRMSGLIDNVLDFARGRLGGGLAVEQAERVPLRPVLEHVVAELRIAHPGRTIETDFADCLVRCDEGRMGQLVSNLVANALTHGSDDTPIRVRTADEGANFVVSVTNGGAPIPQAMRRDLFKPFVRAAVGHGREGLGLGLYIASEIVKAHGGRITVTSDTRETCFTCTIPMR